MKKVSWIILLTVVLLVVACKDAKEKASSLETETDSEVEIVQQQKPILLSPNEFQKRIVNTSEIQLIDVRTPEEYSEGHLKGAKNININSEDFAKQIEALDTEEPVYLYCRSGGRSGRAAKLLVDMGFTQIYDLDGGITAWTEKELPTEE